MSACNTLTVFPLPSRVLLGPCAKLGRDPFLNQPRLLFDLLNFLQCCLGLRRNFEMDLQLEVFTAISERFCISAPLSFQIFCYMNDAACNSAKRNFQVIKSSRYFGSTQGPLK